MDFTEFDRLVEPLRARSAAMQAAHGFALIEARTASVQELRDASIASVRRCPRSTRRS